MKEGFCEEVIFEEQISTKEVKREKHILVRGTSLSMGVEKDGVKIRNLKGLCTQNLGKGGGE